MNMKKKTAFILCAVLIISIVCVCALRSNYVLICGKIINRSATEVVLSGEELPDVEKLHRINELKTLDLREFDISLEFYEMLCAEFHGCEILWNVPIQGENWDNYTTDITVTSMTPEYVDMLKYFPKLQSVDARQCRDYPALMELIAARPDLKVRYNVTLGAEVLQENATDCTVTNENVRTLLEMLPYLPELKTVSSDGCTDYDALMALQSIIQL